YHTCGFHIIGCLVFQVIFPGKNPLFFRTASYAYRDQVLCNLIENISGHAGMVMLKTPVLFPQVEMSIQNEYSEILSCNFGTGLCHSKGQGMLSSKHNGKLSIFQEVFCSFVEVFQGLVNRG